VRNATSWSLGEQDARRADEALRAFLDASGARRVLLVDRTGQLITMVGSGPDLDSTAFASLAAADFSANDRIASLLGEKEFSSLFHQGERESVYLLNVAGRAILVILFDRGVTLGLIRIRARKVVRELNGIFEEVFSRTDGGPELPRLEATWATEAEHEIDRLFGGL